MIIKSSGFISSKLIRSQNALNFAYILYLKLKDLGVNKVQLESYVPRWFVYSILTGRYSGSPESFFELIKTQIAENDLRLNGIASETELLENLRMSCIPSEVMKMNFDDYFDFLTMRRKQMALKIRDYYFSL